MLFVSFLYQFFDRFIKSLKELFEFLDLRANCTCECNIGQMLICLVMASIIAK